MQNYQKSGNIWQSLTKHLAKLKAYQIWQKLAKSSIVLLYIYSNMSQQTNFNSCFILQALQQTIYFFCCEFLYFFLWSRQYEFLYFLLRRGQCEFLLFTSEGETFLVKNCAQLFPYDEEHKERLSVWTVKSEDLNLASEGSR